MKSNNALLAFFFFFFLASFGFSRAGYIYDSDGDRLNNGGNYHIVVPGYGFVIKGAVISASESSPCSLAVVAAGTYPEGWATKIVTTYPLKYITNDYPLNISFSSLPSNTCTNTPNWVVTNSTGFHDVAPVMVGKFEEFPVPLSGYFYIKPYEDTKFYKFAFCYSKASCGYVTLKSDSDGNYRLAVSLDRSEQPLVFTLVKVKETSDDVVSSGISMVV